MESFLSLLAEVRACTICKENLPLGPRPVLQLHPKARVLIAGQAPGRKVHESGVPFDDASGNRLREWLGVTREVFYDPEQIAILPMGLLLPWFRKVGRPTSTTRVCTCLAKTASWTTSQLGNHIGAWTVRAGLPLR